jgi:murein L,D-transpeptidase YcbB/YkuD
MQATLKTDMPAAMVQLWKARSFRWGGDFRNRKDAMHFEFMGTPEDAARLISELGLPANAGNASQTQTATTPSGPPTLKRPANGPPVRVLQTMLNANGASLEVDGSFGASTEEAVKIFQTAKELEADGIVGPKTWEALG